MFADICKRPISVAARPKAVGTVCGHSLPEIVGLKPAEVVVVSLVNILCCQVEISATKPIPCPEESCRVCCV
jgi:hypothetical protein